MVTGLGESVARFSLTSAEFCSLQCSMQTRHQDDAD